MSIGIVYVKGGTKIQCDTSVLPRPRPRMAYPIPNFPGTDQSLLSLALATVAQTGRPAVQVTSTPITLPGTAAGDWTLFWMAYQGAAPTAPTWNSVPVQWPAVALTLDNVMPSASFVAYLQRVEAGQTFTYATASITTSADYTLPIANAGLVAGANLVPNGNSELGPIPGVGGALVYDTTQGGTLAAAGYGGSKFVRRFPGVDGTMTQITPDLPCVPGDQFTLTAWIAQAALGGRGGYLIARYKDSTGAQIATVPGYNYLHFAATDPGAGNWAQLTPAALGGRYLASDQVLAYYYAPANAVSIAVFAGDTSGNVASLDNIVFTKINSTATSTTPGAVIAGAGLAVAADGTLSVTGGSSDKNYAFPGSGATWTIAHGMGKFPSVSVVTSAGDAVYGASVHYADSNNLTLSFASAFSGTAYLN